MIMVEQQVAIGYKVGTHELPDRQADTGTVQLAARRWLPQCQLEHHVQASNRQRRCQTGVVVVVVVVFVVVQGRQHPDDLKPVRRVQLQDPLVKQHALHLHVLLHEGIGKQPSPPEQHPKNTRQRMRRDVCTQTVEADLGMVPDDELDPGQGPLRVLDQRTQKLVFFIVATLAEEPDNPLHRPQRGIQQHHRCVRHQRLRMLQALRQRHLGHPAGRKHRPPQARYVQRRHRLACRRRSPLELEP